MTVTERDPGVLPEEDTFAGARDVRIHVRTWVPAGQPAGVVVISHGFAEHGGRYAAVAQRLLAEGIAVVAPDHRGHGLSGGRRTSVRRFGDYSDDLGTVITRSRERWPVQHLILLGHSMGGLIALDYSIRPGTTLDGLVLSAPAACPGDVSKAKLAVGRVLSVVAPNAGVLRLPLNRISRDQAVVDAYNNDPLVFRTPIRARLGAEMLDAMDRVDAALPAMRMPLLVMQGTADGLVDPGCGPHVYERAGSPDKTLKMYEGLWHEIFNEPERDRVLADLTAWLQAHLA
jgi:alpha-beta hydrolase superfamily lysophospholipase